MYRSVKIDWTAILMAVLLFLIIGVVLDKARSKPNPEKIKFELEFIKSLKVPLKTEKFDCQDKILASIRWFDLPAGSRFLEGRWYGPGRRLQKTARYELKSLGRPVSYTRFWLKILPRKSSNPVGPEEGYDWAVGQWNLEVYLDKVFITRKSFQVDC